MSHSAGFGVRVSAAELNRRRAIAEGRATCAQLRRRALDAAGEAVGAGADLVAVPHEPSIGADDSESSALAAAEEYERRIRSVLASISAARTGAVLAAFDRQAPPSISGTIAVAWRPRSVSAEEQAPGQANAVSSTEDPTERATSMIASLAELEDARRRDELVARITAVIGMPDAASRLDDLHSDAESARRDQARRDAIRREADEIVAGLRQYPTPAIRRACDALAAAATREELKVASLLARAAREEAEAAEQEAFVVEQTTQVLRELGYDVGEAFVEAAEHGEFAVATNHELEDYGLQLRVLDGGKRVLTNTIALGEHTTRSADVAAEERVCSDLDTFAERLGRRGVRLDRYFESKPGELEIERRLDVRNAVPRGAARRGRSEAASRQARS